MDLKTFINFKLEISRILKLYNAGVHAFEGQSERTSEIIKENSYSESMKEPVYLNGNTDDQYLISGSMFELREKYNNKFISNLREILTVRLISTLEVYLVEMVRDIFLKRKDLFHSGQKIEFNHAELISSENITSIWNKLINKECRKLQNQGFSETKKFYKRNFNIEFGNCGLSLKSIEKLHDKRHLLVHRLGKIDTQFQHKYKTKDKTVKITNDDFYEAIELMNGFGKFIHEEYLKLIENPNPKEEYTENLYSYIHLFLYDENPMEFLESDFNFRLEDEIIRLKDIVRNIEFKEQNVEINLYGKPEHIKQYHNHLKRIERQGRITIEDKKLSVSHDKSITKNDIKKVNKVLLVSPEVTTLDLSKEVRMPIDKVTAIQKIIKNMPNTI